MTIENLNLLKSLESPCLVTDTGQFLLTASSSQGFHILGGKMKRQRRMKQCECGCGMHTKPGKMFIWGHNARLMVGTNHHMYGKKGEDNPSYGMTRSKEQKENISKGCRGKNAGENNPMYGKKGKDHPSYGRKRSKEFIKSISGKNNAMYGRKGKDHPSYGRKRSKESLKKRSGKNHHNWKGGISSEMYCQEMYCEGYKDSIKERDDYMCQNPLCWCKCIILCIHHINYDKKDCRPKNVITLCLSCNSRANYNRKFWQKYYEGLMKEAA